MARVEGRRPDETSSKQRQSHGAELWTLLVVLVLAVIGIGGLMYLASLG